MADVWVMLLIVAFFGACVGLVRGCERILGGDDTVDLDAREPSEDEVGEREAVGVGR
jgi:hypothetical protein